MRRVRAAGSLFKEAFQEWVWDRASQLGAAIAFYMALSLAPLIIFAISLAGLFFSEDAARAELLGQFQEMAGPTITDTVEAVLRQINLPRRGLSATAIGGSILIFSASGVFWQVKRSLNTVWEIRRKPDNGLQGIWEYLKGRLIAFVMVFGAGSLLLLSMAVDMLLSLSRRILIDLFPNLISEARLLAGIHGVKFLISFLMITAVFATLFKVLPDARVAWRDSWVGATVTSLLISPGNLLIGYYLSKTTITSTYGAAGSLLAFLIWVYYSAQVFFYGAEFTQVYARRYGSGIVPSSDAESFARDEVTAAPLLVSTQQSLPIEKPAQASPTRPARYVRWLKRGGLAATALALLVGLFYGMRRTSAEDKRTL